MGQIIVSLPQGVFFPDGSRGTVTAVVLDGLPDGANVQASFRYQMDAPQPTTQKKPARRSKLSAVRLGPEEHSRGTAETVGRTKAQSEGA